MRITEAAQRLGTSPRMLRYRDSLGLLPPVREHRPPRRPPPRPATASDLGQPPPRHPRPGQPPQPPTAAPALHRQFDEHDLAAVAFALAIDRRYDITPPPLPSALPSLPQPTAPP